MRLLVRALVEGLGGVGVRWMTVIQLSCFLLPGAKKEGMDVEGVEVLLDVLSINQILDGEGRGLACSLGKYRSID